MSNHIRHTGKVMRSDCTSQMPPFPPLVNLDVESFVGRNILERHHDAYTSVSWELADIPDQIFIYCIMYCASCAARTLDDRGLREAPQKRSECVWTSVFVGSAPSIPIGME